MIRQNYISTADGTRLFYRDWGDGAPVVFLPAWALNCDFWEYQMAHLRARGLRCISYDRRGHGRSSQPASGYDFDTLSDDLARVLDHLDLQGVTLVGHAMGCGEVVRYLSRHSGHRVARAVLIATITPYVFKTAANPNGPDRQALEDARVSLASDRARWFAGDGGAAFFGAHNSVSAALVNWATRLILQSSLKALLDLHRVYTAIDFSEELRRISVPTLIVHGDADVYSPLDATARSTAEQIPGSRLEIYEGAAHGLLITHQERLNADIETFARV